MKTMLLAAGLLTVSCLCAFAQGAAVIIQNEEAATFYYTVDPPDLANVSAGSPLAATRVASFFAAPAQGPQFIPLAPGAQATLQGLSTGSHLLVGFFALESQDTFPVRVITLQADSAMGERFYAVYGSPALVEAARGVGRLAQFTGSAAPGPATQAPAAASAPTAAPQPSSPTPAQAAQAPATVPAAAAQTAPAPLVSVAPTYSPAAFSREAGDGVTVQPISSAHSWALPGTHVATVDARIDRGTLKLSLTTADAFSPDVSYFIYAYASRTPGASAAFTLELRPRALPARGACLLWQPPTGSPAGSAGVPSIFGSVTVVGKTATLVADLKALPPSASQVSSFDLTSCRFDRAAGVYEEFYFATVALADIPVTR